MKPQLLAVTIASVALLAASASQAAGYYVDEQSALRLGDAFSGGAASASDASAAYYGPASMLLVRNELVLNAAAISVSSKFQGTAETLGSAPITGGQAKTETTDVLPTLYFVNKLTDEMAIGAFINAPYSTGTQFGKQSVARYQATDGEILGIDAGVSLAYRLHEKLTVGGGLIMQYLKATTGVAVNTSALCKGAELSGELPIACATLGLPDADLGTSTQDGYFEMEGHNTVLGYQLGALLEFSPNSRLGLNYRSKMSHSLAGEATLTFPASAQGFTGLAGLNDTQADGRVSMTTPEVANLSYYHQLGDLGLQADLSYTNWARFDNMAVTSRDATIQEVASPVAFNWKETYRAAVGANYKLNSSLTLRGGFAYDQSPIKNQDVKVDFAFDDYKAISLGASYNITENLALDAGLQHTLKQERKLAQAPAGSATGDASLSSLNGKITTEVTSFALGLRLGL